ncbi:putative N-acetyltransferase YhbS [Pedobacter sp. UYP30]|uniref:GNAT family N-acetyltransferase n=1 Tax=Pedobacter sp. UYP30 TaxID=1756400 RepID=UPI003396600E
MHQLRQTGKNEVRIGTIIYKVNEMPNIDAVIEVYNDSGINRPTSNRARIANMYENANLIVCAFHQEELIGVARSLTDYVYCCYLSDLAVKASYQKQGIGKELIGLTREAIGEDTTLILLSAPEAMDYYPKVGFERIQNGFIIRRKQ